MKFFRTLLPALALTLYLGSYNGNLALFRKGCETPVQVYPYPVCIYPSEDQKALKAGIPIKSNEELTALLETYLS